MAFCYEETVCFDKHVAIKFNIAPAFKTAMNAELIYFIISLSKFNTVCLNDIIGCSSKPLCGKRCIGINLCIALKPNQIVTHNSIVNINN